MVLHSDIPSATHRLFALRIMLIFGSLLADQQGLRAHWLLTHSMYACTHAHRSPTGGEAKRENVL